MKLEFRLEKQKGNFEVSMLWSIRFRDVCPDHFCHEKHSFTVLSLLSISILQHKSFSMGLKFGDLFQA